VDNPPTAYINALASGSNPGVIDGVGVGVMDGVMDGV
jgi:hypothetical protein